MALSVCSLILSRKRLRFSLFPRTEFRLKNNWIFTEATFENPWGGVTCVLFSAQPPCYEYVDTALT